MDKDILLFDLDGTLTDPKVGITRSVAFALDKAGIHVENPDDLCAFIGPPLKDMFMELYSFDEAQGFAGNCGLPRLFSQAGNAGKRGISGDS